MLPDDSYLTFELHSGRELYAFHEGIRPHTYIFAKNAWGTDEFTMREMAKAMSGRFGIPSMERTLLHLIKDFLRA